MQTRKLSQFSLAGIARGKVGRAQYQRNRHVQNVQAPTTDDWSMVLCFPD